MAYTPTEWATGDVITAEKLNKIEEGIEAGSVMIVEGTPTYNNATYSGYMQFPDAAVQHYMNGGTVVLKVNRPENDNTNNYGFPLFYQVLGASNIDGAVSGRIRRLYIAKADTDSIFNHQELDGYVDIEDDGLEFYSDWS